MSFESAFKEAVRKLRDAERKKLLNDFVVIGAIALSRVATIRSTGDIDFAIKVDPAKTKELASFLRGESREGDIGDPLAGCLTFRAGKGVHRVNIQLVRFHKGLEEVAFMDSAHQTVRGTKIPFASWQALLILKLFAGSALDLEDAEGILRFNSCSKKELKRLETIAQKLRLSRRFTKIVERARAG